MRASVSRSVVVAALALPFVLLVGCGSNGTPTKGIGGDNEGGSSGSGGRGTGGRSGSGGSGGNSASGNGGAAGNSTAGAGGSSSSSGGTSGGGGGMMSGATGGSSGGDAGSTSDSPPASTCGWKPGYTGPLLGRCNTATPGCVAGMCGISVSKGGFLTLDDFEIAPTSTFPIGIHHASRDGRTGGWTQFASPQGKLEVAVTDTTGGSQNSTKALHYAGPAGTFEATLALPMGTNCYDASAYEGISFWIKGNPDAGNAKIKFNMHTPVTEPATSGGACTAGCYDHFGKVVDVTSGWTRHVIKWADLTQTSCTKPTPAIPEGFEPHKQIVSLSFSVLDKTKGFDFWVDDVTFDVNPDGRDAFEKIVTKPLFDEMFATAKPPYSHQGLIDAVKKYGSKFGGSLSGQGTPFQRKNEAAAFLAQIAHETGSLMLAEEIMPRPGTSPYHGRGAIQLTLLANYQRAEQAGFAGIVADPAKVSMTADYAFGTAIWFWMTPQSAVGICHDAIMQGNYSQTTRIINGIECNADPMNVTKQNGRAKLYWEFAAAMGINGGPNVICQ